jgi:hypothetical protein
MKAGKRRSEPETAFFGKRMSSKGKEVIATAIIPSHRSACTAHRRKKKEKGGTADGDQKTKPASLHTVPSPLLIYILSFLPLNDHFRSAPFVSRLFARLCKDPYSFPPALHLSTRATTSAFRETSPPDSHMTHSLALAGLSDLTLQRFSHLKQLHHLSVRSLLFWC